MDYPFERQIKRLLKSTLPSFLVIM